MTQNRIQKGENIMIKRNDKKADISATVKSTLNMMLKLEANSASCGVLYEPKAPEGLNNFKRK